MPGMAGNKTQLLRNSLCCRPGNHSLCCPSNRLPKRKSLSLTKRHHVTPLLSAKLVQGLFLFNLKYFFSITGIIWKRTLDHLCQTILFLYFTKNIYTFILYLISLHPPHNTSARGPLWAWPEALYTYTTARSVRDPAQELLSSRTRDTPEILEPCQQRTGWTCWPPAPVILQHWTQLMRRQIQDLLFTAPRRADKSLHSGC